MKVVILAGGLGTRLSEETHLKPKPMVEIGGKPILWHIMKSYASHGFSDFIICLGYKGEVIKDYFLNYYAKNSDMTIDLNGNRIEILNAKSEPWKITLIDTGFESNTAERLRQVAPYIDGEFFCFTYGDGVSDVNISDLVDFHRQGEQEITLTAVYPEGRYGALSLNGNMVRSFHEKPNHGEGLINGGYFVVDRGVLERIPSSNASWEADVLPMFAKESKLGAYRHDGFWKAMDTLRERHELESLWAQGVAPWKRW